MIRFRKHIALFLLLVLSVYIVPKEFIHALYDHDDTIDYVHKTDSSSPHNLGTEHTHCALLSFETDVFFTPDFYAPLTLHTCFYSYVCAPVHTAENAFEVYISLRGPPLV